MKSDDDGNDDADVDNDLENVGVSTKSRQPTISTLDFYHEIFHQVGKNVALQFRDLIATDDGVFNVMNSIFKSST